MHKLRKESDLNLDPFSILYGDLLEVGPLLLEWKPGLVLAIPDGDPELNKEQLLIITQALGIYYLVPQDVKRSAPLDYLHRRLRQQVEQIFFSGAEDIREGDSLSFAQTEMACSKLPAGPLPDFKLRWNEWDMVLAAISYADKGLRKTSPKLPENQLERYRNLYLHLCHDEPSERQGLLSCVRCGKVLKADEAAVDPKAYRCQGCPPAV